MCLIGKRVLYLSFEDFPAGLLVSHKPPAKSGGTCLGKQRAKWISERCTVLGDAQKLPEHSPEQLALDGPASARGRDQVTSRGRTRWTQRSLPTSAILWFYENKTKPKTNQPTKNNWSFNTEILGSILLHNMQWRKVLLSLKSPLINPRSYLYCW